MDTDFCTCGKATSGELYCSQECRNFDELPRSAFCSNVRACQTHVYPVMCRCTLESRSTQSTSSRFASTNRIKNGESWNTSPESLASSASPSTPSWPQKNVPQSPSLLNLGPSAMTDIYTESILKIPALQLDSKHWLPVSDPNLELRYQRKPSQTAIASRQPLYTTPSTLLTHPFESRATQRPSFRLEKISPPRDSSSANNGTSSALTDTLGMILTQHDTLRRRHSEPLQLVSYGGRLTSPVASDRQRSLSETGLYTRQGNRPQGYMSRLRSKVLGISRSIRSSNFAHLLRHAEKGNSPRRQNDILHEGLSDVSKSTLCADPQNLTFNHTRMDSLPVPRLRSQLGDRKDPSEGYEPPTQAAPTHNDAQLSPIRHRGRGRTLSRAGNGDRTVSPLYKT